MGEAKKHHYVPQAYLKFFAQKGKNQNYTIRVIDKEAKREFISNISNIAAKRNFYKIENNSLGAKQDPLFFEKLYSRIENEIPRIINNTKAVCTLADSRCFQTAIKNELAELIIIQLLRGVEGRKFISNLLNIDRCETYPHVSVATNPAVIAGLTQYLVHNRFWEIWDNTLYEFIPFITSDNPVMLCNPIIKQYGLLNNGTDDPYTVISMPITPKYKVDIYPKNGENCKDAITEIKNKRLIRIFNNRAYENCIKQVYTTPNDKNNYNYYINKT